MPTDILNNKACQFFNDDAVNEPPVATYLPPSTCAENVTQFVPPSENCKSRTTPQGSKVLRDAQTNFFQSSSGNWDNVGLHEISRLPRRPKAQSTGTTEETALKVEKEKRKKENLLSAIKRLHALNDNGAPRIGQKNLPSHSRKPAHQKSNMQAKLLEYSDNPSPYTSLSPEMRHSSCKDPQNATKHPPPFLAAILDPFARKGRRRHFCERKVFSIPKYDTRQREDRGHGRASKFRRPCQGFDLRSYQSLLTSRK